jgi:hypothetical protein
VTIHWKLKSIAEIGDHIRRPRPPVQRGVGIGPGAIWRNKNEKDRGGLLFLLLPSMITLNKATRQTATISMCFLSSCDISRSSSLPLTSVAASLLICGDLIVVYVLAAFILR